MRKKAIDVLSELSANDQREKYPNFPEHFRPKTKYTDKTANGLTKCIIDFLSFSGWQAERISTTGRPLIERRQNLVNETVNIKWIRSTSTNGSADISATIKGRSVKIEVKVGKDKQSEAQKAYQKKIEQAGGVYVIARDFEGFMAWYINFFQNIWK